MLSYSDVNGLYECRVDAQGAARQEGPNLIMAFIVLGVVLLVLWMADLGPVGVWPWWAVLWPFAAAALWWWWADATGWTKRREMDKLEAKRRQRRIDNLDALGMDAKGRRGRSESAKQARRRF